MASSSSSELFEVLEKGDLDLINQAITISIEEGCKETATTVKTKAFRKGYGTTGKDYWEKYIIPNNKSYLCFSSTPPANYIEHMGIVRGIQYTLTNIAPLIYVSNINSVDQSKFESLLNLYSSNVIAMKSQYYEVINVSVGWCYAKNEYFVYSGTRTLYPPIYQATQVVNNSIAIKALLHTEKKDTNMTILPIFEKNTEADEDASRTFLYRYDPTERPVQYKLEKISINKNHLVNLGGGSFDGYHKMKYSNLPETSTTGVKSSLLRDHSFAGLEIDGSKTNVDEECIPDWRTVECVWREDTAVVLPTPLEAAYQIGNEAAIQLLLRDPLVCTATTLQLRDTHQKYLEITLQSMSSLTSLKLESTGSGGSVPECVFRLKTLRHLDLRGSDFVHIPDTVAELTALEELNVSGLPLQSLPVIALGKLSNLSRVDCSGIRLASPPPEIVKQGPIAVAQYILALGEGAERNTDVLLMLIGDGEAGKTSLLQALKNNETNCACTIGVDDRTVGIDISSFQPHPEKPLKFFAWDFGGQGIYAIMQQLFVSRRALYPLLWRVRQSLDMSCVDPAIRCDVCKKHLTARPGETQQPVYRVKGQGLCHSQCVSYEPLISSWTERLQFRVPGVSMILIATHIDCATPEEVEEQCAAVTRVVECIQARQAYTMEGIAPVRFCNNGQSLRVNNMTGEGIAELREKLVEIAQELDFYGEVIPASYVRLRQKLREMQRKGDPAWRTWLLHNEYASIAKECGLSDATALQLATQFLHDVGELRYFSHSNTVSKESSTAAEVDDSDSEDDKPYKGGATFKYYHSDDEEPAVVEKSEKIDTTGSAEGDNSAVLLSNTVFPNPFWIVDVLRGLIRHDHSSVLVMIKQDTELSNKDRRTLRRRVYRLMQRGFLHESLLQYVWRGVAGMSESVTSNADEFARLIALMKAFDILMDKPGETFGAEWIVPTLAAGKHSHTVENDSFIDDSLPFVVRLVYDALPPYFDMMLVAHVINRRIADSVDFIGGAAAFHKLAEKALLFAGLGKVRHPDSVFRRDQLCEERFQKVLRDDQCHVVIAASSRQLMLQLMEEVSSMNAFFPGLRRLCALFPCYSCRMKRIQLKQSAELLNPPVQTTVIEDSNTAPLALCTTITDGTQLLEAAESADIVSQDYLSSALQADSMNCGSYFVHNQEVLQPALLKYAALNAMLGLEKDEEVAVNFNEDSVFGKVYGAETPRLFQEALTVMMRLKTIIAPTAEDGLVPSSVVAEETPSVELENCLKAVAERQYNIAFQQAGAELPTLRTITKYCSKHVDALFIAWEVCPELEVLCMSLNSALEDSDEAGRSGKGLTASELSREDAAPEYMHLLRSAVELVHAQQRPQSPNKETSTAADACKELLIDRALDITLLRERFPALVEFEQRTLSSVYGGSSTVDAQAAQYRLLTAIFHCLDTALRASEENVTNLESDKKAVSDLRELIIDGVDVPALQNWYPKQLQCWIGCRLKHYIPSDYEAIFHGRFESNREGLELKWFIHQLEATLTTLHLTVTDISLKKFTILEPTFDINTYSTIKEAFIAYAEQHQPQLTLLAEVMEIASEEKLEQFSNLFYYERNLFDEFFFSTRCKQSLENAEYSLMFWIVALFLKSIQQASRQKPTLSKAFEKANTELLITEDAKTISFTELKELWDYNIEIIHLAKSKMSIIESLFPEHEKLSEIEFCDDPESFHLNQCWDRDNNIGPRKKKFHHITAAYMILKEFLSKLANWNPICKSVAEQSKKMRDWEKLYPVSSNNSDELEKRYEELKKDNSMHMIGLKLAFNHREIAISLLETFSSSVLDNMENNVMEVIRTWEYLKEGHDVLLLPDLIKERIADHEILLKLQEQCDFSNDNLSELTLFIEEIVNKRKQLATYREEIALLVKEEFNPWLEIQETLNSLLNDRNTCMKTTVEDFKTRHECSQHVHTLKCTVITEQNENIKNIIIQAQEEAMKWKEARLNIAAALKEGPLRAELLEVVNLAKRGIATYNQLRTYREYITSNKVEELVKVTKERLSAYHQLMCLRDSYGPPWYFGAGRREAVPHPDTTCSIDVDCLAREKWCNDMDYFISAKGLATECMCPGEAAALTDPNLSVCAQPAQSCAIYISHSKNSNKFAEKLALAMEDAGVSRQSIRIDPDKYPELLIGDIVRFNPAGESITDCTEHSLLTGMVLEVNESTREVSVRTIEPCYQSTYRGLSPVAYTLDVRRSEKNRQLMALSKAVGKNHFHLRDGRGCIVQVDTVSTDIPTDRMYVSIPGGERQVRISELKLGEAPSRENIGAAVTDDLVLFRLLKLLPGYPVIIRIDGMEVHGTVSEGPLTVSYESAPGVTVTEVLSDRKRVIMPAPSDAVSEAKVMLCLIDAAYSDSDRCRVEFLRAQAHGLGVIPVILADYEVTNYQQWWPKQMPTMAKHSLFVDMRNLSTTAPDMELLRRLCATQLGQTLRVLLSEFKGTDDQNTHIHNGVKAKSPPTTENPAAKTEGQGPQYVYCEACAIDGAAGGAAVTGKFDRWQCQALVGEWTAQELARREQYPDTPAVCACPVTVRCSAESSHELQVRDVLAVKAKKSSYPCPHCLTKGVLPPYCFDREACLAELEYNKGGAIMCKRCHGSTPLHELLVCEVFLSYCWGPVVCPDCTANTSIWESHTLPRSGQCHRCNSVWAGDKFWYKTQRLVLEVKGAVEPEAGVMCWQDVDRLVGGKDLEREMEVGVKHADVVVIFLDDGYVRSANCRKEYLHTTKHGKYVIPVLLQGYRPVNRPKPGEQWWPDSMSSLSQFEPIELTEPGQMEAVLFEICERIQSRFHRAQRFPTADDAIAYLRDYSSWGLARRAFLNEGHSLQQKEVVDAHLGQAFVRIDKDGNNQIDEAELTAFLDAHQLCLSTEQIGALMREADIDQNGLLSLEELKLAVFTLLEQQEEELQRAAIGEVD